MTTLPRSVATLTTKRSAAILTSQQGLFPQHWTSLIKQMTWARHSTTTMETGSHNSLTLPRLLAHPEQSLTCLQLLLLVEQNHSFLKRSPPPQLPSTSTTVPTFHVQQLMRCPPNMESLTSFKQPMTSCCTFSSTR